MKVTTMKILMKINTIEIMTISKTMKVLTRLTAGLTRYAVALACLSTLLPCSAADAPKPPLRAKTELDEYLSKKDPEYAWSVVAAAKADHTSTLLIELTSQKWLDEARVDRPIWKHWLTIVVPHEPKTDHVFLFVGGGSNAGGPPSKPEDSTVAVAHGTRSIVAELRMIPNQPLVFEGDGNPRKEDDLIAYAWVRFMQTGDPEWLPRLPMVKSVVRAMDTVEAAVREKFSIDAKKFVVAGGSKRGWTTWLSGVDPRVVAIAPIVIDVVNVRTSMEHHFAAYGFWAPAVGDYVRHGVIEWHSTPEYERLLGISDPYAYRHRLKQPKFLVNASGDQFFLPDSSQFYLGDLAGERYLRYVPNADHSLKGSDAIESLAAWFLSVATDTPRPKFQWTHRADNGFRVSAETAPKEVRIWSALNPDARDFRVETLGRVWESRVLEAGADGSWLGEVEKPAKGWRAFFVELSFDGVEGAPLKFTTDVRVVPDTLPHADKLEELLKRLRAGTGR